MRIGVDIDEVLADFLSFFLKFHNDVYGTSLAREQFYTYKFWMVWGGTKEESIRKAYEFYKTPYFDSVPLIKGAKEGIDVISQNHELTCITSRPNEIIEPTKSWLDKYFPSKFNGIHFTNHFSRDGNYKPKSSVCKKVGINVLIEDQLDYAVECAKNGIDALLLDCPWNQSKDKLPKKISRVYSWKEICDYLN